MITAAISTVHTTGVNWESVLTIICTTITTISLLGALVARSISGKITTAIAEFQVSVISTLNNRLIAVETVLKVRKEED